MISKFAIKNYRNIIDASFDNLKPVNIIIGPNNSGKTNLLRAMSLYANIVSQSQTITIDSALLEAIRLQGGSDILSRSAESRNISFEWSFNPNKSKGMPYTYSLDINIGKGTRWQEETKIKQERLTYTRIAEGKNEPFKIFDCDYTRNEKQRFWLYSKSTNGLRSILLQPKSDKVVLEQIQDLLLQSQEYYEFFKGDSENYVEYSFMKQEDLKKYFAMFFDYASANFNLAQIRRNRVPVDEKRGILLKDASNFAGVLYHCLTDNGAGAFRIKYDKLLSDIFYGDSYAEIYVEEEGNELAVKLLVKNEKQTLSEQSDGTLKAMVLALLLAYNPAGGISVMTLDEPELNLHPAWIHRFAGWLLEHSIDRQIFVSTHSPELLDKLTEAYIRDQVGVIVFNEWTNKFWMLPQKMVSGKINEGWELGDLYRIGDPLVGGWPK